MFGEKVHWFCRVENSCSDYMQESYEDLDFYCEAL